MLTDDKHIALLKVDIGPFTPGGCAWMRTVLPIKKVQIGRSSSSVVFYSCL